VQPMAEQIYTINQIREKLESVFKRYGIRKAILFGSYGKGTATQKSDIDLLVESNLKGLRFVGFTEEVKEAVNKDVDVFDVSHIKKNSEIDSEITETGVMIYEE